MRGHQEGGLLLEDLTVRRCVGMQAAEGFQGSVMIPVGKGDWG